MKIYSYYMQATNNIKYSICTFVSDWSQYSKLHASIVESGFNDFNSEFLTINNSVDNQMDAFESIRHFIKVSKNELIILVHQDVLFPVNGYDKLTKIIEQISHIDPHWAVLSNAGRNSQIHKSHIAVGDGERKWYTNQFPGLVDSVDEHFIVLKKTTGVTVSRDLEGFHFYGTELCIVAHQLGYTCYAIDFFLIHFSHGNINETFYIAKNKIEKKYSNINKSLRINTMCACICTHSGFINKIIADLYSYMIVINSPYHLEARVLLKRDPRFSLLISRIIIKTGVLELIFSSRKMYQRIRGDVYWWCKNWRSRL
jgi:hypothetical protein